MKLLITYIAVMALAAATIKAQQTNIIGRLAVNGRFVAVTTNSNGGVSIYTVEQSGTNTFVAPATLDQATQTASGWIEANNPADAIYYGTNDWVFQAGSVYVQDSGQAAAKLDIAKFGLVQKIPNMGLGAALLQGNNGGKNGTAGAYGYLEYRKPIGDVAGTIGLGGGYDNRNYQPMGVIKVDLDYRQNPHLGEYAGVGYAFENSRSQRGLIIGGGVCYSF